MGNGLRQSEEHCVLPRRERRPPRRRWADELRKRQGSRAFGEPHRTALPCSPAFGPLGLNSTRLALLLPND